MKTQLLLVATMAASAGAFSVPVSSRKEICLKRTMSWGRLGAASSDQLQIGLNE
jgi:hypothetical protein